MLLGSVLESHKQTAEILAVLINTMILGLDVLLFQKADHLLLQLSAALSRNDLNDRDAFLHGLVNNIVQGLIYFPALVEDLMQVECKF